MSNYSNVPPPAWPTPTANSGYPNGNNHSYQYQQPQPPAPIGPPSKMTYNVTPSYGPAGLPSAPYNYSNVHRPPLSSEMPVRPSMPPAQAGMVGQPPPVSQAPYPFAAIPNRPPLFQQQPSPVVANNYYPATSAGGPPPRSMAGPMFASNANVAAPSLPVQPPLPSFPQQRFPLQSSTYAPAPPPPPTNAAMIGQQQTFAAPQQPPQQFPPSAPGPPRFPQQSQTISNYPQTFQNGSIGGLPPGHYGNSIPHPPTQQFAETKSSAVNLLQERHILPTTPVEPPKIQLPPIFEHPNVNCSPEVFRATVNAIPQTQELLKKSRLPLGLVIHPFRDMKQLSVLQSSIIVRCRTCRTYINPFVNFTDQRHWRCNICGKINDLPEEFHFDPATKTYGEPTRRPEIKNATVEFIAPVEYMVRAPQPSAYVYVLDVSATALETGYLTEFCNRLMDNLDHVPGDARTLVGFVAVDSQIRFFVIRPGMPAKELVVNDVNECFLPSNYNLLINLHERKDDIRQFLEVLPSIFASNTDSNNALGAAVSVVHSLLADIGGRVTVIQGSLPSVGPGSLTSREDPNLRAAKEVSHLGPANDYYKHLSLDCCSHQVAIDLFLVSNAYSDLSTLSEMAKFCGGCVYHYPSLHALRNPLEVERFGGDLDRYFTRKIGWEAVLRIRCSKGMSLHTFHGNFFVRSTDLLALANINPDAAFGVQIHMDENLHDIPAVAFQAALLYTTSRGERRIRVHTLCLPVTNSLSEIHQSADVQTIVSLLAKMAVDRCVAGSLSDAREALVNACIDAISAFSSSFNASQRTNAVLASETLKLLPLYILGLLKHQAFAYGTSIKLDHRVAAMNNFKTMPHFYLMLTIYPNLYPLHTFSDNDLPPPLLQLSFEKIDRNGAYLMDTGTYFYFYVGQAVSDAFCRNVFGISGYAQIDEDLGRLPELQNPQSEAIRKFIDLLRSRRPFSAPLRIIREDSPSREIFVQRLIDDRNESTFSYVEFLQHILKEISPR